MLPMATVLLTACLALPAPRTRIDPHDLLNREGNCALCHRTDSRGEVVRHEFVMDVDELCLRCHGSAPLGRSHPRGVAGNGRTASVPEDFPLDGEGRMTCATCHDPHGRGYLLTRLMPGQEPVFAEPHGAREIAYYRSYYLRIDECGEGYTELCLRCHSSF